MNSFPPIPEFGAVELQSEVKFMDGTTVPQHPQEECIQSLAATTPAIDALDKLKNIKGASPAGWSTVNPLRRLWRHDQRI